MSNGQITLTQYSDNIAYARFYDDSAAGFVDNDDEAVSIGGTPFTLWGEPGDVLYIGKATTFAYVGFRVGTAGVGLGNFTIEYWDGDSWEDVNTAKSYTGYTITAIFDNTAGFTTSGYIAFTINGDWATTDVGGLLPTAYWIRISQSATPGTSPTAYNLMRNVTLDPPLHVEGPAWTIDNTYADINGVVRDVDMTYNGPQRHVIGVSQVACGALMGYWNLLIDWKYEKNRIFIENEAVTSPIEISTDAYFRTMQGKLVGYPLQMMDPGKMGLNAGAYYMLEFKIDTVVTQSSTLGLSL